MQDSFIACRTPCPYRLVGYRVARMVRWSYSLFTREDSKGSNPLQILEPPAMQVMAPRRKQSLPTASLIFARCRRAVGRKPSFGLGLSWGAGSCPNRDQGIANRRSIPACASRGNQPIEHTQDALLRIATGVPSSPAAPSIQARRALHWPMRSGAPQGYSSCSHEYDTGSSESER